MSYKISDECISCGACQPECPNEAIFVGGEDYELNGETHPALSQDLSQNHVPPTQIHRGSNR